MKLYVESKDQILETETDSRGRVSLGREYANQEVTIVLLEDEKDEEPRGKTEEPYRQKLVREFLEESEIVESVSRGQQPTADRIAPKDDVYLAFVEWCKHENVDRVPEKNLFSQALYNLDSYEVQAGERRLQRGKTYVYEGLALSK